MEKIIMKHLLISCLIAFLFFNITNHSVAQGPPDPGGTPSAEKPKLGGGSAPIGGGEFLLMSLAVAYGFRKRQQSKMKH
jgi:hypothetical protein